MRAGRTVHGRFSIQEASFWVFFHVTLALDEPDTRKLVNGHSINKMHGV